MAVHGIVAGYDAAAVQRTVGRVFGADADRLRTVFGIPGCRVKRGLDYLTALRYQAMLRRLGCRTNIDRA